MRRPSILTILVLFSALAVTHAQTLAKPGWMNASNVQDPWWKHAIFYEVYPRSFQDSNGDGVGDLNGITNRLDYLQSLGIDAIWLTPIYPSPQVDFGYDVSDYTAIDPQYGTLADFDKLVAEAGRRHIRILMDFVVNHTSDKHPWFQESASSKDNPKRDWYVWRDGKPGPDDKPLPPNNWQAGFGHSAWQFDPKTNQFYYHFFYVQQPDLNWRNPEVQKAMADAERFWFNRGVAGFRLDAITTLFEDPTLRDTPPLPGTNAYGEPNSDFRDQMDQPGVHEMMRGLRKVADGFPGQRILIGEIYTDTIKQLNVWYGPHHDELQLPMDTQLGFPNGDEDGKLNAASFRKRLTEAQTDLNGNIPLVVFDNHDRPRSWDRYGNGKDNESIARVIATIELTSNDAALMYYGQELGMVTTTPTRKEDVQDPIGILGWPKEKGRDGERTPMQWDKTADAGFSKAEKTWLPVPPSYTATNVETETADPNSLLNWYQKLIQLRRNRPSIFNGAQAMLDRDAQNTLVWVRKPPVGSPQSPPVVVICNLSAQPVTLQLHADIVKLGLRGTYLRTLLRSDNGQGPVHLDGVIVPAFGVYIGELGR